LSNGSAGRVAVITGGGRGIGAATARALANDGAHVIVAARSIDEVSAVAEALVSAGLKASAFRCDVSSEASVNELAAFAAGIGTADILINNAGIGHSATVMQTTLEDWNRVISVNATGAFLCTRAFLPSMLAQKWGRIVNVASMAGLGGARYIAAYTASKHAMVGLTRAVAADVDGTGVTCNAVCPAFVDTPMTDHTIANVVERTGKPASELNSMVLATTGQARLITADEVAIEILSLCDVGAAAINGDTRIMDGSAIA
jgi:NAD(P)-dependent dehydrogenase (short-subunit alcohol dehydrogenase family)